MSKIKSFKYAGTPEQVAKVVAWLEGMGVLERSGSRIGTDPAAYIFVDETDDDDTYYQLGSGWEGAYIIDLNPKIPPEYELAIFGSTRGITGKIENPWIENTGTPPGLPEGTKIDTKWCEGACDEIGDYVDNWSWELGGGITHYRIHKSDAEYFVAPETAGKAVYNKESKPVNIPENTSEEVMDALGFSKHEQDLKTFKQVTLEFKENFATFEDGSALRKTSDGNFEVKASENAEWRLTNGSSVTFSGAAAKWESVLNDEVNVSDYEQPVRNKYMREIKPNVWVDVYDVIRAFAVTDGALQHLLKKALAVGQRGHKDAAEDYSDILASAKRAKEMHEEWNK